MKACLISLETGTDFGANQNRVLESAEIAVRGGAELILFPEAAVTGLVITGSSEVDYHIAESIPGPRNSEWRRFAEENRVFFAAGLIERDGSKLFDSAILFGPRGDLLLHYRRIDSGWHPADVDSTVYGEGETLPIARTNAGTVAFLLCGDLWNEGVLQLLKKQAPDIVLFPFARSYSPKHDFYSEWGREITAYLKQWRGIGSRVMAVNLLGAAGHDESIGGSWYVDSTGMLAASSPVHSESLLFVEVI